MSDTKKGLSWRWKLSGLTAAFAVLPIAALAYWELSTVEEAFRETTLDSLEAIAAAKADAIEQLTANRRRDVEQMATLLAPRLQTLLEAEEVMAEDAPDEPPPPLPALQDAEALSRPEDEGPQEPEPPETERQTPEAEQPSSEDTPTRRGRRERETEATEQVQEAVRAMRRGVSLILWDQAEFEELLIIDDEGRVRIATYSQHEDRDASELAYFQSGLRTTYVQPVFMSPITERLTMVIATPIRDDDAQVIGVLAARLNLSGLFDLVNDTTGLGRTGETVVGRVLENDFVLMAPTRHDPQAALNRRFSLDDVATAPMVEAARGQGGRGDRQDYRGKEVLTAWRPVPSLEWGLVVKQDEAEAMAPANEVQQRTVRISLVILVLAVVASLLVARELVRPLRELKEATDRISRGDFDVRINIRSGDEIGELADSFERMVAAIKFFREHARSLEEEAELEAQAAEEREAAEAETSARD